MAYFHCLIGGGSSGGGYELTVTCDAAFAGTTITATDGVTTLTQTCPSASPYEVVFAIPNGGEWTISGTISGQTYSTAIDIPDSLELHSVPEGSTVLPTDDIQTWLACAGITDKSYTTLNEVLADSTTLLALMSDNNAVDYLVRSTTWASGITADSTAMTDIGANNYCANTLLSDSTWLNAIANSTYIDSVLNVKVPTMTSNTTPSGVVSASHVYLSNYAWQAFDGNTATKWVDALNATATEEYIQYEFPSTIRAKVIKWKGNTDTPYLVPTKITVYGSTDGTTFSNKLLEVDNINADSSDHIDVLDNITEYKYYRIYCIGRKYQTYYYNQFSIIQFYGRVDV